MFSSGETTFGGNSGPVLVGTGRSTGGRGGSLRAAVGSSNSGSGSSVALHSGQSYGGSTGGVVCLFSDGSQTTSSGVILASTSNVGSTGSSGCLFFMLAHHNVATVDTLVSRRAMRPEAQQAQYRWHLVARADLVVLRGYIPAM